MATSLGIGGQIVTDGLVLCLDAANKDSYPGSGTTWYDLTGSNNGTLTNGPTFNSGNGGSLVFDGVNDYVTLGTNKLQYQDNFTVESIFYFPNAPTNPGAECGARHPIIYNHDYGYNLLMRDTGLINFYIYNTSGNNASCSSNTSQVDNWCHAVGYKQGTEIGLYINGVIQQTSTLSSNQVYYITQPFTIGGYGLCGSNRFYATGNISTVKVYNRVLSAQEITQNYNVTKSRFGL